MICPRSLTGAAALRVVAAVLLCKNDRTESVRRTSDLMANDPVFRVDAAAVVSDIIAGEAVMLHRVSGDYFSTDGVGCLIWEWIGGGQSRGSILNGLNQRFATDPAKIETAVDAFLADLVKHKLIYEIDRDVGTLTKASFAQQPKSAFTTPILHVYSDIRRMILLDPIHDVAEVGWPIPAKVSTP
jgi:Coenzyme PQQ synthesis protein D (PqqD)